MLAINMLGGSLIVSAMEDMDGWNSTLFPPVNLDVIAQPNLTQLRIPTCRADSKPWPHTSVNPNLLCCNTAGLLPKPQPQTALEGGLRAPLARLKSLAPRWDSL